MLRRLALALTLLALLAVPAWAQPPEGYDDSVGLTNADTTRDTPHEVIYDQRW